VYCTIAYSGTSLHKGGEGHRRREKLIKGDIDYTISHRTELEHLNKDVMTDGLDGMVKKVNSCT
jgi:hypothetical protein